MKVGCDLVENYLTEPLLIVLFQNRQSLFACVRSSPYNARLRFALLSSEQHVDLIQDLLSIIVFAGLLFAFRLELKVSQT